MAMKIDDEAALSLALARQKCAENNCSNIFRRRRFGPAAHPDDLVIVTDWFCRLRALEIPEKRMQISATELGIVANSISKELMRIAPREWAEVEACMA